MNVSYTSQNPSEDEPLSIWNQKGSAPLGNIYPKMGITEVFVSEESTTGVTQGL